MKILIIFYIFCSLTTKINWTLGETLSLYNICRHVLWLLSKQWLIISTWKRFALVQQAKAQHVSVSTNLKTMKVHHTVITQQWICQSPLIHMNEGGRIKVFGLNLPGFFDVSARKTAQHYIQPIKISRGREFLSFCVSVFLCHGWICAACRGRRGVRDRRNRFRCFIKKKNI